MQGLILAGDIGRARYRLGLLERQGGNDARVLARVAELHTHLNDHQAAYRCHARVLQACPTNPDALYNLASSSIAMGEIERAEACLNRVVVLKPDDFDAWYNRSTLRRQTAECNHVAALKAMLATPAGSAGGLVALNYALAKELEDLGDYAGSWQRLCAGAAARRAGMAYDVAGDERTMADIRAVFDEQWMAGPVAGPRPQPETVNLFVVGLPRSGTTLVERILSSHSQVDSLGEINDLALTMTRLTGPGLDRASRVRQAAALDAADLGAAYRRATVGYGRPARVLIDKTPLNFLYLGLIQRALPDALVIHVRRHPLDSALAMFKTLFRMGYPFSYDLDDLARYYLAYDALMAHWRAVLPEGRVLDVDYEDLIADPEAQSRRLIAHAGLDWEPDCLNFHRNPSPTATASAVQVREPIYTRAVGRWRHYAEGLAPLREGLQAGGVRVDG